MKYIEVKLTEDQLQYVIELLKEQELKTGFETRFSTKLKKLAKAKS